MFMFPTGRLYFAFWKVMSLFSAGKPQVAVRFGFKSMDVLGVYLDILIFGDTGVELGRTSFVTSIEILLL